MTELEGTDDACVHRWILSAPSHDVTPGVCAHCGAERDFTGANKQRPPGPRKAAPK